MCMDDSENFDDGHYAVKHDVVRMNYQFARTGNALALFIQIRVMRKLRDRLLDAVSESFGGPRVALADIIQNP